ncbi:hypothetical protein SEA_LONELYSOIL_6 [Microbacterium phage Lonelysoil]|nr:hypothetical protein SEA_LONELYSOIL_6 [Microbacterium phage Lonelysoil]
MTTARGYLNPGALGHHGDREFMLIALEREAVRAVSEVISAHDADFVAALAPLGIDWHTVMLPEWKRALMPADLDRLQLIDDAPKRLRLTMVCSACGEPATEARGSGIALWRCAHCGCSTVRVLQVDDPDPEPSSPAVDGVYMTDLIGDDEGFGERIEEE